MCRKPCTLEHLQLANKRQGKNSRNLRLRPDFWVTHANSVTANGSCCLERLARSRLRSCLTGVSRRSVGARGDRWRIGNVDFTCGCEAPSVDATRCRQPAQGGDRKANGMPQFRGMPDADAAALYAYIINAAWDAHDGKVGRSVTRGAH